MKNINFENTNKKTFAEIIISELKRRKITQQEIANAIGEDYNSLKQCLYCKRPIKESVAIKICNFLNLDFAEATKNDPHLNIWEDSDKITFGQKLGKILKAKNIDHKDFAEAIEIAPSTLSYIINNNRTLKLNVVCKICSFLNVSIYNMIKDDPKYKLISDNFNTSILSILKEAGIDSPIPNYEEVLINLIRKNKEMFIES